MSTASTPINVSAPLELNWNSQNATSSQYYVYMHFAEVVNLKANQSRSFNVTVNGKFFYGPTYPCRNLNRNQLNGSVPAELIKRSESGSLFWGLTRRKQQENSKG